MNHRHFIHATRYHDFSAGHRVAGHENVCAGLHGHNYRVHFTVRAERLDEVGRVVDFSVIKRALCQWLEDNWDHRMLLWTEDKMADALEAVMYGSAEEDEVAGIEQFLAIVRVPFNPTAENMAAYLLHAVGPTQLPKGMRLVEVRVEETRKCGAEVRECDSQESYLSYSGTDFLDDVISGALLGGEGEA